MYLAASAFIGFAIFPIAYATANDRHIPVAKATTGGMAKCSETTLNIYWWQRYISSEYTPIHFIKNDMW